MMKKGVVLVCDEFKKIIWDHLELTIKEFLTMHKCHHIKEIKKEQGITYLEIEHDTIKEKGVYEILIYNNNFQHLTLRRIENG